MKIIGLKLQKKDSIENLPEEEPAVLLLNRSRKRKTKHTHTHTHTSSLDRLGVIVCDAAHLFTLIPLFQKLTPV